MQEARKFAAPLSLSRTHPEALPRMRKSERDWKKSRVIRADAPFGLEVQWAAFIRVDSSDS